MWRRSHSARFKVVGVSNHRIENREAVLHRAVAPGFEKYPRKYVGCGVVVGCGGKAGRTISQTGGILVFQ